MPKGAAPKRWSRIDLITGTGAAAAAGDTITVNYVGALYPTARCSTPPGLRKQTFSTPLGVGAVIAGWDQGLVGMRVGGRRELIIPPALAYKARPAHGHDPAERDADLHHRPARGDSAERRNRRTGATVAPGATAPPARPAATGATGATG